MLAPDFGLMFLGFLTFLAHVVILSVALGSAVRSLLRLRRPGAGGLRFALVAAGLSLAVLVWAVVFSAPGRTMVVEEGDFFLWMPFFPLAVASPAITLWVLRGRRLSGTIRLMAAVAAIALTLAGGRSVQLWDLRRKCLHNARLEEELAARFREAAEREERCEGHIRSGQRCDRCRRTSIDSIAQEVRQFRGYAEKAEAAARAARRRAER